MKRRTFLGYALVGILPTPLISFAESNKNSPHQADCPSTLSTAIKANFGSGFEVLNWQEKGGFIEANISHLENRYLVTNAPNGQWSILTSTID